MRDTVEAIARIIDPDAGWDRRLSDSENVAFLKDEAALDRRQGVAINKAEIIMTRYAGQLPAGSAVTE